MSNKEDAKGFEFPCEFQVKAMGHDDGTFEETVVEILSQDCEVIDQERIVCNASRNGKYVSVSVIIEAQSHEHRRVYAEDVSG